MFVDVEETLGRELREVADGLQIPAMPPLPQQPPRVQWHRLPLLVAAAVVLIVAGPIAVVATNRGGQELPPAPPSPSQNEQAPPSPSRTGSVDTIPRTAPAIPYVLDQRLYVDGVQVPGTWWSVDAGDDGWLGWRSDYTFWWGRGAEPTEITGVQDTSGPVISPNGRYIALASVDNGEGVLTGFDTSTGDGLGSVPVDLGDPQDGSNVFIRAVTNDGKVIAQGLNTSLLWLPLAGNGDDTVDLTVTAPGQVILGSTQTGLVVTEGTGDVLEGREGEPYLAEISDAGELTRIGAIPAHDAVEVSPGAEWLAWIAPGNLGGEVTSISELEAQTVDGTQQATLTAPAGWAFNVGAWVWEDDDHLISRVDADREGGGERMARCSAQLARCVLIKTD